MDPVLTPDLLATISKSLTGKDLMTFLILYLLAKHWLPVVWRMVSRKQRDTSTIIAALERIENKLDDRKSKDQVNDTTPS